MSIILLVLLCAYGAQADVRFDIINKEPGPVWVGIQGHENHAHLSNGGFVLDQGQTVTIKAPDDWSGVFWPRTWCDPTSRRCLTGACGTQIECQGAKGTTPITLVEVTLKGWQGLDYYGISLVEGFNLRAFIEPVDGQGGCGRVKCVSHINGKCPDQLQIRHNGMVIACNSACIRYNTDQYCCRGAHDRPETCKSSDWPVDYAGFFKQECPDAYSYAYDDKKSTFTCQASHYRIQFGVY